MAIIATLEIIKHGGKVLDEYRHEWKETVKALRDGVYRIQVEERKNFTTTRYKYYFAYLLPQIMQHAKPMVQVPGTGEERHSTVDEFHDMLKLWFNSGIMHNPVTGEPYKIGLSTTGLDDRDFIDEYEERIAVEFCTLYPDMELLTRPEWTSMQKAAHNQSKNYFESLNK